MVHAHTQTRPNVWMNWGRGGRGDALGVQYVCVNLLSSHDRAWLRLRTGTGVNYVAA